MRNEMRKLLDRLEESGKQDLPHEDVAAKETTVTADEEDIDLAALFAETENSMAKAVQAATSDGETDEADEVFLLLVRSHRGTYISHLL